MAVMCRLCLRWSETTRSLHNVEFQNVLITEMLENIFGVTVENSKDLPPDACVPCLERITEAYCLGQELLICQERLQQLYNNGELQKLLQNSKPEGESLECDDAMVSKDDSSTEKDEMLVKIKIESFEGGSNEAPEPFAETYVEEYVIERNSDDDSEGDVYEQIVKEEVESVHQSSDDEEVSTDITAVEAPEVTAKRNTRQPRKTAERKATKVVTVPNKCYVCSAISNNKEDLLAHMLVTHNDMLPYVCKDCSTPNYPIRLNTLGTLNRHFESHAFTFKCDTCPLLFRSSSSRNEHVRNVHVNVDGFTCDTCGKSFKENRKFRKHVQGHRNTIEGRYKCSFCEKPFKTGTMLRRHEIIHSGELPYICPYCHRGFNHESNFKVHKMRHVWNADSRSCGECGLHFTNNTDLRRHMQEHFPNEARYYDKHDLLPEHMRDPNSYPLQCQEDNCTYLAQSVQLMWAHYRAHYKMYECSECAQKFSNATSLNTHVDVVHRGIRKFECHTCHKTFGYLHKLKEHLNSHYGIKRHECKYCEKRFVHTSNLVVHMRSHTGVRPHVCGTCGASYKSCSGLQRHEKTHE